MSDLENINLVPLYKNLNDFVMYNKKEAMSDFSRYLRIKMNDRAAVPTEGTPTGESYRNGYLDALSNVIMDIENINKCDFDTLKNSVSSI